MTEENPSVEEEEVTDHVVIQAWHLAKHIDFRSWELQNCPPRGRIEATLGAAEAYARDLVEVSSSLRAFYEQDLADSPWEDAGRGIGVIDDLLHSPRLVTAFAISNGRGSIEDALAQAINDERRDDSLIGWAKECKIVNRYLAVSSAKGQYGFTNFLPRILGFRMLDLALSALDRGLIVTEDKKSYRTVAALEVFRRRDEQPSGKIITHPHNPHKGKKDARNKPIPWPPADTVFGPFAHETDDRIREWHENFSSHYLAAIVDGTDVFAGGTGGKTSNLRRLINAICWQRPAWLRAVQREKQGECAFWEPDPMGEDWEEPRITAATHPDLQGAKFEQVGKDVKKVASALRTIFAEPQVSLSSEKTKTPPGEIPLKKGLGLLVNGSKILGAPEVQPPSIKEVKEKIDGSRQAIEEILPALAGKCLEFQDTFGCTLENSRLQKELAAYQEASTERKRAVALNNSDQDDSKTEAVRKLRSEVRMMLNHFEEWLKRAKTDVDYTRLKLPPQEINVPSPSLSEFNPSHAFKHALDMHNAVHLPSIQWLIENDMRQRPTPKEGEEQTPEWSRLSNSLQRKTRAVVVDSLLHRHREFIRALKAGREVDKLLTDENDKVGHGEVQAKHRRKLRLDIQKLEAQWFPSGGAGESRDRLVSLRQTIVETSVANSLSSQELLILIAEADARLESLRAYRKLSELNISPEEKRARSAWNL